jgi:hypothetical protein
MPRRSILIVCWLAGLAGRAEGQVQIRVGDSTRANYSELHEGLQIGSAEADSVVVIMRSGRAADLWRLFHQALLGKQSWNHGLLALTRIAELRDAGSGDSVLALRKRIAGGQLETPPGVDPEDLLPALHAIQLERERAARGDRALLADLLSRVPEGRYDLGDAWVFGRLGDGAADTVARRLREAGDQALRIRYLTLLSFSDDTTLIPFLAAIYVAPDSFGLPHRIAIRASDGLLWIGTRRSLEALRDARVQARSRGTYADPALGHADLDFLGNDSTYVLARTGYWLDDWIERLPH